jgi:tRNA dimethylallyltransferase
MQQNTRRFAKRQLTWFRKINDMTWLQPDLEIALKSLDNKIKMIK